MMTTRHGANLADSALRAPSNGIGDEKSWSSFVVKIVILHIGRGWLIAI
jgi:hypothetical protein